MFQVSQVSQVFQGLSPLSVKLKLKVKVKDKDKDRRYREGMRMRK